MLINVLPSPLTNNLLQQIPLRTPQGAPARWIPATLVIKTPSLITRTVITSNTARLLTKRVRHQLHLVVENSVGKARPPCRLVCRPFRRRNPSLHRTRERARLPIRWRRSGKRTRRSSLRSAPYIRAPLPRPHPRRKRHSFAPSPLPSHP